MIVFYYTEQITSNSVLHYGILIVTTLLTLAAVGVSIWIARKAQKQNKELLKQNAKIHKRSEEQNAELHKRSEEMTFLDLVVKTFSCVTVPIVIITDEEELDDENFLIRRNSTEVLLVTEQALFERFSIRIFFNSDRGIPVKRAWVKLMGIFIDDEKWKVSTFRVQSKKENRLYRQRQKPVETRFTVEPGYDKYNHAYIMPMCLVMDGENEGSLREKLCEPGKTVKFHMDVTYENAFGVKTSVKHHFTLTNPCKIDKNDFETYRFETKEPLDVIEDIQTKPEQ